MSAPDWINHLLHAPSMWGPLLGAFLAGLALNLTPCVYPMIPVTLAFFSSQASGRPSHVLRLALVYVVGMSATYAALGLLAANTGALLGSWLQLPAVLIGIAGLMVALALSMFGLYDLQPPAWILQRFGQGSTGTAGALVMGLTVGLIAAPCIGPFVIGLLLYVSQLAKPVFGFFLFFVMGLGMGTPYALLGLAANKTAKLPKAGPWLVWIKHALGIVLLGLGLHFLRPLIPEALFQWIVVVGIAAAGVFLGWLDRPPGGAARPSRGFGVARQVVGVGLIAAAVWLLPRPQRDASLIAWKPYSAAALEHAAQAHRLAMIDVYADWCIPCVELDHVTFRHPDVAARLRALVTLRIDATLEVPPEAQALLDHYEIVGVPTVLLFDAAGRERPDLRVTGFVPPEELLRRLNRLAAP